MLRSLRLTIVVCLLLPIAGAAQDIPGAGPLPDDASLKAIALSDDEAALFRLDGLLSEPFWERAEPATGFRQREPDEGDPATETT
ncbi:MAG TPA: hypothetical protein VE173_15115, partial [Longimicrobiales bacterium]|nr:hypothetical protein [Longimicrobiales bacterium]